MKNKLKILLLVALGALISCSGNDEEDHSDQLSVDISSSNTTFIPASTQSCEEQALGTSTGSGSIKDYFELPTPTITWNGDVTKTEVRIILIQFKIDTPPIANFQCILSGTSLGILFYKRDTSAAAVSYSVWDQKLGFNSAAKVNTTSELKKTMTPCKIYCGGISLPKGTRRFTVSGTWEVIAVERAYKSASSSEYKEYPLKVTGDFNLQNIIDL